MGSSRRIMITGLSSPLGGRLAQLLERHPDVDTIVGVDTEDPRHELERTEFVRVAADATLLRRIIRAARIDTVLDTRLQADTTALSARQAHEINVVGTRNLLAAAGGADTPVRKLIFKGSDRVYGSDRHDPAFFTEELAGTRPPRSPVERSVVEAEEALAEFSEQHPDVTTTTLRFAAPIGAHMQTGLQALLGLPVMPAILGFDPRCQFIHEDDVIGVMVYAVDCDLAGPYNAAADGVLALSEVAALLGKPLLPVLPPWGAVFAAMQLRRLGVHAPVETLRDLRHGRGLDNRRLKASGYRYRYTSREAVLKLRAHQRVRPLLVSGDDSYRYEREVEAFLRWSPSVQRAPRPLEQHVDASDRADGYEHLDEAELVDIVPSLDDDALVALRDLEAAGPARPGVLEAIEQQLAVRSAFRAGAG